MVDMIRARIGRIRANSNSVSGRHNMLTILLYPFPKVYLPLQMPSTFFGLLMHVGAPDKKNKTEAMYCPARDEEYGAGDTSDLVLDCGGTISFTQSFVYLGSLLHRDSSDHHDVDARIKKAFGALRDHFFSTRDVLERLTGKIYSGGVLAILLYGCESWCLTAGFISRLRNWHNKRIREMCRVTMCQSFVHQVSSTSSQKRTGVF